MENSSILRMPTNRLARAKNVQKFLYIGDTKDKETEYLVENIIYTWEPNFYILPQEVFDFINKIDFDKEKQKILIESRYFSGYGWPGVENPVEESKSFFSEEGVLLAKNIVSEKDVREGSSNRGYKLFLLADKRLGLFLFNEISISKGASSCWDSEFELRTHHSKLEKILEINKHGVCSL